MTAGGASERGASLENPHLVCASMSECCVGVLAVGVLMMMSGVSD